MFTINAYGKKILVNDFGYPLFQVTFPQECADIAKFDIERIKTLCNRNYVNVPQSIDILAIGYWTNSGRYVQPVYEHSELVKKVEVDFQ